MHPYDIACTCDVCWPPFAEDALFLIPERAPWEHELWVWADEPYGWIRAPRTKVWREGMNNKELPILRTGCRNTIYGLADFDEPFAGVSDVEIAARAAEKAGLSLPCKVTLCRYGDRYEDRYVTTILVGEDIN